MAEGAFDDQLTYVRVLCLIFLGAGSVFGQALARALSFVGRSKNRAHHLAATAKLTSQISRVYFTEEFQIMRF